MSKALQRDTDRFTQDWLHSRDLVRGVNLRVMQDEGLDARLFTILNLLDPAHATTAVELARRMNVHPSTIMRSLESLEADGWVVRERNPDDRRELRIVLAPRALRLRARLQADFTAHLGAVLARMPAAARRSLVEAYTQFVTAARQLPPPRRTKENDDAKR